jgi:dienelactone hydrolase
MRYLSFILVSLLLSTAAHAGLKKETIEYKDGDTPLEGYLVYDDAVEGKRPGIIVVHDWMGPGAYSNGRAEQLAQLGYAAFAVDIYGKGVRPKDQKEAGELAGKYKEDRALMRSRLKAGLDTLLAQTVVDGGRVGAIGYCFGGTAALEMGRAGMDVSGVVSFHGGLQAPVPAQKGALKAKVLVLHGADDPLVPPEEVEDFQKEMNSSGADWQMVYYSGAVHSFTRPDAGDDKSKGVAYNEKADKRSWEAMKVFFSEIFNQNK